MSFLDLSTKLTMSLKLWISKRGASQRENLEATSHELCVRALLLKEAAQNLRLPYLYEIIEVDPKKRETRKQLGMMVAELVQQMGDEMMNVAIDIRRITDADGSDSLLTKISKDLGSEGTQQSEAQGTSQGSGDNNSL